MGRHAALVRFEMNAETRRRHAVTNGVSSALTTTEVAITAVAQGAIGTYRGVDSKYV